MLCDRYRDITCVVTKTMDKVEKLPQSRLHSFKEPREDLDSSLWNSSIWKEHGLTTGSRDLGIATGTQKDAGEKGISNLGNAVVKTLAYVSNTTHVC